MTAGEPFALKILRGANQKGTMGINAWESHPIPPLALITINPMRGDERSRPREIKPTNQSNDTDESQRQLRRVKKWDF